MKDELSEDSSQGSLERLKQTKIELYSKQSLEELLSPENKFYVSESNIDIHTIQGFVQAKKIDLGCYFSYVKLRCKHGEFEDTIKKEYPDISIRTVQRYMKSFIHGNKTIDRTVNSKKSKQIREKKARGEVLTQAEERNYKLQNTLYAIKKTLLLIDIHGVEETLNNYIPEEKKESLVKDIVVITTDEVSKLEKEEKKLTQEKVKLKQEYDSKKKIINKKLKLVKKEKVSKTQLLLEFKPREV